MLLSLFSWGCKANQKNKNGQKSLEHKADGEAKHVLSAVEDEVFVANVIPEVGGGETIGDVVKAILKRKVKEHTRDVDAQTYHETEVDGVDVLLDLGVGEVDERVITEVGEGELCFRANVER